MKKSGTLQGATVEVAPSYVRRLAGMQHAAGLSRAAFPLALAIALFLSMFLNLHSIPLLDVDEGAFSEATREMLAGGDYITTYLNGNLRFDKPILIYWLQALSVLLLGVNEFAFRLPSALAGICWMAAILVFTRRQADRTTGFVAALIGATTLGIGVIGRAAIADALLNLFLVLAMFDIYRYLEQPSGKYRYRVYLWMGLGVLTKGPIAILIPFAVSGMFSVMRGQWRIWLRAAFDPLGWLVLLAVAGPWYALEYQQQGMAFIEGFFMRHNVERFKNPLQGHGGSMLYYFPAILVLLLPFTGLFVRVLPTMKAIRREPLAGFLWIWFLFVLAFFSVAGTKLPHYLIYGMTPLFILMAIHRRALRSRWLAFAPPVLFMCFVLAMPTLLGMIGSRMGNAYFREMLMQPVVSGAGYYVAGILLLAATLVLAFNSRIETWKGLVAAGFLSMAALSGLVLPAIVELQQGPVKEAAMIARQSGAKVARWQIHMPSFSVYLGDITRAYRPSSGEDVIVFTRIDRMASLGPAEVLYRRGGIVLLRPLR